MHLKTKLKNNELTIGTWLSLAHPAIAEIMVKAGFDWVAIDLEHSVITLREAEEMIRIIELAGSTPLVRLSGNDPIQIKRVMDAGAHGLIVPMVNSTRDLENAVKSVHYPDRGTRGVGLARAQQYGFAFHEYMEWLKNETVIIAQIEHIDAVNNIEKLVEGLGLELYTEVIDWEEMKDLQLAFFKSGVPHIDAPQDHAFFATMYKFSLKHNIKTILTGGNYSTECVRNPLEWMYYQSDSRQLRDIHKRFGKNRLEHFPVTNILWHKVYLPYVKKIKLIRPLDYLPYNKEEATKLLESEFGFQRYPQKHFESRFTKFYESYWLYERFGFDTRKVQLSPLGLDRMWEAFCLRAGFNPL